VLIGASGEDTGFTNAGAAYVHDQDFPTAMAWNVRQRLTASDESADAVFGASVQLSGDIAAVGAQSADPGAVGNAGAMYIFYRNNPTADSWGEMTILSASDKAANDKFGSNMSFFDDTLAVGSPYDAAGSVYIFRRDYPTTDAWGEVTKVAASTGFRLPIYAFSSLIS